MKCPNCNTENRFNAVICENCGTSLLDAPADEPVDLDRFAPAHSDPVAAAEPAQQKKADADNKERGGSDFAEKAKDIWGRICAFVAMAAGKVWDFLKAAFKKIGEWLDSASAWIAGKLRQKPDDSDDDDEEGEKFRKIILAVMLVVIGIILLLLFSVFGSCASCTSCAPASITGTWVEAASAQDGYHASDYIIELTDDGTLIVGGQNVGTYEHSEDMLNLSFNGLEYSGIASADAEELSVALHGYSSVTLNLIKLTDETGLSDDQLADLYPDEK